MSFRAVGLAVALLTGTVLSGVGPARAEFVTGQLSIGGDNNIDYTANTITFLAGSTTVGSNATITGSFVGTGFNSGDAVTMRNEGVPLVYTSPSLAAGSNLFCGAGCIFSAASGTGNTAGFNIVGPYSVTEVAGVSLNINATGFIHLTGFDPTPGLFFYTTQGLNSPPAVTFSATAVAVPGPVVGAGLPGLVMLVGGLVAWTRRRKAATA